MDVVKKIGKSGLDVEEGFPELAQEREVLYRYDGSRAEAIYGIRYRTMEETTKDIIEGMSVPPRT